MFKYLFSIIFILVSSLSFASEVNIYTSRHYDSDDELYEDFRKETGIKINVISGNGSALLERMKSEGENSPADIFFTVDAGNLWKIQKEGYFQSISSAKALSVVPENLRGPNNEWIAKRQTSIPTKFLCLPKQILQCVFHNNQCSLMAGGTVGHKWVLYIRFPLFQARTTTMGVRLAERAHILRN